MLIRAYGLFWHRDQVDWYPGRGRPFHVLGRIGEWSRKLRVVDIRTQRGIYVIYGDHGAHYVGLASEDRLGWRIREHARKDSEEDWDKFSWFAFDEVLLHRDADGLCIIHKSDFSGGDPQKMIRDVEALLIKVLNTKNIQDSRFKGAEEWKQILKADVEHYLNRVSVR